MEPFRYHIYMCTQKKPEGAPSCLKIGAQETLVTLKNELAQAKVSDDVQVTECVCLGICGKGPNMVIYPQGIWYTGLNPQRISKIVNDHIVNNNPVDEFIVKDAESLKKEIIAHDQMVQIMKDLMEKAGVAVVAGPSFGEYGEGFIRLSYANSQENIRAAIESMSVALGNA